MQIVDVPAIVNSGNVAVFKRTVCVDARSGLKDFMPRFISDDLFDACQVVRKGMVRYRKPSGLVDDKYGKRCTSVMALVLHGDYSTILEQNEKAPAEIADALEVVLTTDTSYYDRSWCGGDGDRHRTGCVLVLTSRAGNNAVVALKLAA